MRTVFSNQNKCKCDITAHTVLLYVLFCLTHMYCTYGTLYTLCTFPVSLFCSSPQTTRLYSESAHFHLHTCHLSVIGFTILNTLSRVHPFHLCWATISIFGEVDNSVVELLGITSTKKCTSYLLFLTET